MHLAAPEKEKTRKKDDKHVNCRNSKFNNINITEYKLDRFKAFSLFWLGKKKDSRKFVKS